MEEAGKPIAYKAAALMKVWVLGFAGEDQPGVIHAGTLPGGHFTTRDGGKSWAGRNRGMLNDYLPNPEAEWGHDPHLVTLCPAQPERLWQQNHSGVFTSDGGASWQTFREGLPQEHCYDVIYRHALDASGGAGLLRQHHRERLRFRRPRRVLELHRQQPAAGPLGALRLMPHVTFTRHLQTFFPKLKQAEEVEGATVREVIDGLEKRYPGFALYVADETGRLRRHVNVFVGDEIFILQALSGG